MECGVDFVAGVLLGVSFWIFVGPYVTRRYFSKPVEVQLDEPRRYKVAFCPHCQKVFSQRGMANHVRAAHKNVERVEGTMGRTYERESFSISPDSESL